MTVAVTAHVNFRGEARKALSYYQSVFGGEVAIASYTDIGAVEGPDHAEEVAFGRLDAPNGFKLMAYDVQPSKNHNPGENAFYLTLQGTDGDEISDLWNALAEDARNTPIPLAPAAFAPLYGMLTDRYGVTWIFGADTPPTAG